MNWIAWFILVGLIIWLCSFFPWLYLVLGIVLLAHLIVRD